MHEGQATLDGLDVAPWVGITTITKDALHPGEGLIRWAHRIGAEGKSMDEVRAKRKGEGTGLHASLASVIDERGAVTIPPGPPQVRAFAQWLLGLLQAGYVVHEFEHVIEHRNLRYRGRADVVFRRDQPDGASDFLVVDVKSGKSVYRDAHFQVAAYVEGMLERVDPRVFEANQIRGGVLLLTAEGDAIFEHTAITGEEWTALLTVYRAVTRISG